MKRILLTSIAVAVLLCAGTTSVFSQTSPKVFRKVNQDPVRVYQEDRNFYFVHEVVVDSLNCAPTSQSKSCGGLAFTETQIVVMVDSTEKGVSLSTAQNLYQNPNRFFETGYRIEPLKHVSPLLLGLRHAPPVMTQWGNTYNSQNREVTFSIRDNVFFDSECCGQYIVTQENENSLTHWRVMIIIILVAFFVVSLLVRHVGQKSRTMYLTAIFEGGPDVARDIVRQTFISMGLLLFIGVLSLGLKNYSNAIPAMIFVGSVIQLIVAIAYGFVERNKSLTYTGKRLLVKIFIFISLIALFVAHYGLVGEIGVTWNLVLYVTIIIGVVLLIRVVRPFLVWCKELRYEINEFGFIGFVRKKYSEK